MAKKCKVVAVKPALKTVVFEYGGKEAWITGDYKVYGDSIYIEDRRGALICVDKPAPKAESAERAKPKAKRTNSNAVKSEDAIALEE